MKILIAAFTALATIATAGTFEDGYAGCLTKDALDEFTLAFNLENVLPAPTSFDLIHVVS